MCVCDVNMCVCVHSCIHTFRVSTCCAESLCDYLSSIYRALLEYHHHSGFGADTPDTNCYRRLFLTQTLWDIPSCKFFSLYHPHQNNDRCRYESCVVIAVPATVSFQESTHRKVQRTQYDRTRLQTCITKICAVVSKSGIRYGCVSDYILGAVFQD